MSTLSVYCSGSIMKGASDQKKVCWTDVERKEVQQGAGSREVVFLNPDDPIPDPSNTLGQFGRDMFQVMTASAVIVDARERRGIGIGVEMAAAATLGTPLIVVAPRNTLYRQDQLAYRATTVRNYVHPHVASLATDIVEDFFTAGAVLASLPPRKVSPEDPPEWLTAALSEYRNNVLASDRPMLAALRQLKIEM
jgi:hypothetical protein